jgi:gas vesicle protein
MKLINYTLFFILASQPLLHADESFLALMSNVFQPIHSFVSKWGTQIVIGGLIGGYVHLYYKSSQKDNEIAELRRHSIRSHELDQMKNEITDKTNRFIRQNYVTSTEFKNEIKTLINTIQKPNSDFQEQINKHQQSIQKIQDTQKKHEEYVNYSLAKFHEGFNAYEKWQKHKATKPAVKLPDEKIQRMVDTAVQNQLAEYDIPALHNKFDYFFFSMGMNASKGIFAHSTNAVIRSNNTKFDKFK